MTTPFWSIMMPVYEPTEHFEEALDSVLAQDEGPERMQIAVVDDASPRTDVAGWVRRVAGDRVAYYRNEKNLRLAGNWNRAIDLARGTWVHLLHQDDWVAPGFYQNLARAQEAGPRVGAAFCRHAFTDPVGRQTHVSALEQEQAGLLAGALFRFSRDQLAQCASIVVRRSVYQALGGYRTDLCYAVDWEMWVRIARSYELWYEPQILASYRVHPGSETAALRQSQALLDDIFRAIRIVQSYVPAADRSQVGEKILAWQHQEHLIDAGRQMRAGDVGAALRFLRSACRCRPEFRWSRPWFGYHYWASKVWAGRLLRVNQAQAIQKDELQPNRPVM